MSILLQACITGITATFAMTLFMNLLSVATGYNLRVPSMLGSMLTMRTKPSGASSRSFGVMLVGNIAHYLIGIIFVLVYLYVMHFNKFPNTFQNGCWFGIIAGIAAVAFWWPVFKLHPLAPAVKLSLYLVMIFFAHIIFGIVSFVTLLWI